MNGTLPTWMERLLGLATGPAKARPGGWRTTGPGRRGSRCWPSAAAVAAGRGDLPARRPAGAPPLPAGAGRRAAGAGGHRAGDDRPSGDFLAADRPALHRRAGRRFAEHDHRRQLPTRSATAMRQRLGRVDPARRRTEPLEPGHHAPGQSTTPRCWPRWPRTTSCGSTSSPACRPAAAADVPGIVDELKSAEPAGDSTRLGAAVRGVLDELRGATPAAIVLLTDGINTEGPSLAEAAAYARRKGVPLFFVGLGSDQPRPRSEAQRPAGRRRGVRRRPGHLPLQADRHRLSGQEGADRALRQEGKPEVLARIEATVGPDGQPQEVRLPYRPAEVGQFRYIDRGRAAARAAAAGNTAAGRADPGPQGEDPRAAGPGLSELRVPLPPQHAGPRRNDRAAHGAAGRRRRVRRAGQGGPADVSRAPRRAVRLRRDHPGRREPGAVEPADLAEPGRFRRSAGQGGALVLLAGPKYMPQAYPRHAAGPAAALRPGAACVIPIRASR